MSSKTGPRLIVHQDTGIGITYDGVTYSTAGSNWEFDTDATIWQAVCSDSIDLHGYKPDNLTFQVSDVAIQTPAAPSWIDQNAIADRNQLFASHQLFITTSPIAQRTTANDFFPVIPGFLVIDQQGVQEIQGLGPSEVIYGQTATYQSVDTINHGLYALTQTNFSQFGLGKPIVADRVYVYQEWRLDSVNDPVGGNATLLGQFTAPPINMLLVGSSEEEPQYMYMHRLAQQYQLQQSYDED